jgi:transcriptional regulator with XRE-family HTH domain
MEPKHMTTTPALYFDFQKLYLALDAERERRGVSWQKVAAEMGVSAGTLKNTAKGGVKDADGVMWMLQWLGVTAATFLSRGDSPPDLVGQVETLLRSRNDISPDAATELGVAVRSAYERLRSANATPQKVSAPPEPHEILGYNRIDTGGVYAVLDSQREARCLTWDDVVGEIGQPKITVSTLKRLAKGGRTGVPNIMYVVQWLGLPIEVFVRQLAPPQYRAQDKLPPPKLMKQIGVLLRARDDMTDDGVAELEDIIGAGYNRLRKDK